MESNQEMSSLAQQRMATMLPELLGAVRGRRRRRVATRVGVVAAMLCVLLGYWPGMGGQATDYDPGGSGASQVANVSTPFACEVVRNRPGVIERFRSATPEHLQWFVGDDELQDFLSTAARPNGIVRISGKVVIASAALDPFPILDAE